MASISRGGGVLRRAGSSPGVRHGLISEVQAMAEQIGARQQQTQEHDTSASPRDIAAASNSTGYHQAAFPDMQQARVNSSPRRANLKGSPCLGPVREREDLVSDLGVLDDDLREIEIFQRTTTRLLASLSVAPPEAPSQPALEPHAKSSPVEQHTPPPVGNKEAGACRTPVPDGPVFSAFRRELAAARGDGDMHTARSMSPSSDASSSSTARPQDTQGLQSQLEEARTSNRMVHRALSAMQRRLKQVEMEKEQLRTERDYFKAICSKYPFQTGHSSSFALQGALQGPP